MILQERFKQKQKTETHGISRDAQRTWTLSFKDIIYQI